MPIFTSESTRRKQRIKLSLPRLPERAGADQSAGIPELRFHREVRKARVPGPERPFQLLRASRRTKGRQGGQGPPRARSLGAAGAPLPIRTHGCGPAKPIPRTAEQPPPPSPRASTPSHAPPINSASACDVHTKPIPCPAAHPHPRTADSRRGASARAACEADSRRTPAGHGEG
jgi:hypothetical protein